VFAGVVHRARNSGAANDQNAGHILEMAGKNKFEVLNCKIKKNDR
jgi:hypothetical protein